MILSLPKLLGLLAVIWLVWTAFRFFEARQKNSSNHSSTMVKANLQVKLERQTTRRMRHRLICRNVICAGLGLVVKLASVKTVPIKGNNGLLFDIFSG